VVAVFAYDPSEWHELFVATAGAGAALAGLVFVAVSINIERILKFSGLPERALETVLLLLSVVVISIIGLIPGQDHVALGIELLLASLSGATVIWMLAFKTKPSGNEPRMWLTERLVILGWGTLPFVIGGLSVLATNGAGLYWVVFGIVGAIVGAVANAWVLLVEILR
jgi:modulator of FtsH protease